MNLIILGAGPVGNSLIQLATEAGHDVVMIEPDAERAAHCADRHDVRVLNMDIADEETADEAGLDRADALIATTTDDSSNLMAMFLGRERNVEVLTSSVNHRSHLPLFEKLGVHVLADPEVLVAQYLLNLTLLPEAQDVTSLQDREQILEVTLKADSPLNGRTLREAADEELMPDSLFIVSVERDDERFFPSGSTRIQAGDVLTVYSREAVKRDQLDIFGGNAA